jgi:glutaredoxin
MRIEQVLKQRKIDFSFVDVAADEDALKYMKRKNRGEKELPQIFVDGEYKGVKYLNLLFFKLN